MIVLVVIATGFAALIILTNLAFLIGRHVRLWAIRRRTRSRGGYVH